MKKMSVPVLSLFLLCFSLSLSAQTETVQNPPAYASLVFKEDPGSYAIYKDTRFGETAYIGLCAIGGNELALRLYIPSTRTELLLLHTFYTSVNSSSPSQPVIEPGTITLIRGDFASNDATKHFLPMIYGWMNAWLHSRAQFDDMPEYIFTEDGAYNFQYWIPVLQMKKTDGITLVTAGVTSSAVDPVFFEYSGEGTVVPGPLVALKASEARTVKIDGLSIPLDGNWTLSPEGGYRIAKVTSRDAYVTVETMDMNAAGKTDTFDLIKQFILYSGAILEPDALRIFVSNEYPCLYLQTRSPKTHQVQVQYMMFIPRSQSSLSVVTLGTWLSVYDGNKDFFDSILF